MWLKKIRRCPCHNKDVGRRLDDYYARCPVTRTLLSWSACNPDKVVVYDAGDR